VDERVGVAECEECGEVGYCQAEGRRRKAVGRRKKNPEG